MHGLTALQPIGIYSIPEISYVGASEVELTKNAVPYEVGVARYRELARGQIAGDSYGMLKLLVSTEDLKLLGVHIFGHDAGEMIQLVAIATRMQPRGADSTTMPIVGSCGLTIVTSRPSTNSCP